MTPSKMALTEQGGASDSLVTITTERSKSASAESPPMTGNLLTKLLIATKTDGKCSTAGVKPKKSRTACVNILPPCRICGNAASGFHYGVNACEACKRFFRRATRRKRLFKCRGQKQCCVRGLERTMCGYCRYMRCLALGMSSTSIKTGRYSHEKRAQDLSEVRKLKFQSFDSLPLSNAEVDSVVSALMEGQRYMRTNDAVATDVMRERVMRRHEEFTLMQNMIGPHGLLSLEEYTDVYEQTGLDVDGRRAKVERWMKSIENSIEGFVKFCKSVPGFCELSLHDQTNLLKASRVEVWFLGAYKGFDAELEMIHAPNGNCHHSSELSQFLGQDYVDCAFQLSSRLKKLSITPEETVLLKAICVMSSDRCQMDNARKIDEKHWRLVKCLLHLIEKNENRRVGLFSRIVSALMALRNLSEISRKYLSNTLVADAAKNHPIMFEILIR